jgi:helix-turn-helix protein
MVLETLDKLLSIEQLARHWGVSVETVRARRREGLRGAQIGRRVLFRLSDIKAFEDARLQCPPQKGVAE